MARHTRNSVVESGLLPVEIVFHPSWWHRHEGISFDEDFFYHPLRRVEAERAMEKALHERFGRYGLGAERDRDLPVVGAVHNAAGYLVQEMLGCRVEYSTDAPPLVIPRRLDKLRLDEFRFDGRAAFRSPAYRRFEELCDSLESRHGFLTGDVNFGGILNAAVDLRGEQLFMDFIDRPEEVKVFFVPIAECIDRLTRSIEKKTGTTSISVNRNVRHLAGPVFLHSECTHTMISVEHYEEFLFPFDAAWSRARRPFGIHYCGEDPHRYAGAFSRLPHLDFLDVGWGGDVKALREHLPHTFLNIRLSPTEMPGWSGEEIRETITRLVADSGDPRLTGVCCINMDDQVGDDKIEALFDTVDELRARYAKESG